MAGQRGSKLPFIAPPRAWLKAPGAAEQAASDLTKKLAHEMTTAWRQGMCPTADVFLKRFPEAGNHPKVAFDLILRELDLHREFGMTIDRAGFLRRYPEWETELQAELGPDSMSWAEEENTVFPEVGEELAGFKLTTELGRGGMGRVFLALQPALADRPVVLKVTAMRGDEHRSLARLQHTHVVPLLTAQELPERKLMIICLPYLGGVTLGDILEALAKSPVEKRVGRDLLGPIDRSCAAAPVPVPAEGPARDFYARETYERSICWIAFCLAEALQHAHQRGLVHLDVKPANVLLGADGMPYLLDFHLARAPVDAGARNPRWMGGTLEYMAPEQRAALMAEWNNAPVAVRVGPAADVYALGVLICEALIGKSPPSGMTAEKLRKINPRVSVGLADIVTHCMDQEPLKRYASAAEMADDLRRFLDDRPLVGVPNRSFAERVKRWRRRRPMALTRVIGLATSGLGIAAALTAIWLGTQQRLANATAELAQGRRHLEARAYTEAARSFEHGRDLLKAGPVPERIFPASVALKRDLIQGLESTRRGRLTRELHRLIDRVRSLYDVESPDQDAARKLEHQLAQIWQARGTIQSHLDPKRDSQAREEVRADLLDLAILWVDLRVRLASDSVRAGAREAALRTLDEAEADWGPSPVLELERSVQANGLGRTDLAQAAAARAARMTPRTAWEYYALGRSLLQANDLEPAADALDHAASLKPQDLWIQFNRGRCALRRSRWAEALDAFSVCVSLAPDTAACYQNRGIAYARLGLKDRADLDASKARSLAAPRP